MVICICLHTRSKITVKLAVQSNSSRTSSRLVVVVIGVVVVVVSPSHTRVTRQCESVLRMTTKAYGEWQNLTSRQP